MIRARIHYKYGQESICGAKTSDVFLTKKSQRITCEECLNLAKMIVLYEEYKKKTDL